MEKIKLVNVSRKYVINKTEDFYAVKNISLVFNNKGFVTITGKSGSGKSTILNMIGDLDFPTEGRVFFDGKDIKKFSKKEKINYYKKKIGILFQSYNLLDEQTVLYNVSLPLLMNGVNKEKAKKKAIEVLDYVGISSLLYQSKANLLSGGEKQRVALARTIVNEPEVILCDEPTGALDSKNGFNVMNMLSEYSKKHLVIMVSHNLQLTGKYSDRIIHIADGRIVKDLHVNNVEEECIKQKEKIRSSSSWINQISYSNFKKRFRRNLFSMIALVFSLSLSFIAVGFIEGKDKSINEASIKQFDFGYGTIAKEEVISKGTVLSLTRMVRPTIKELEKEKKLMQNFNISPNFDAIFPPKMNLDYDGELLEGMYFYPVYSFDKNIVNSTLIYKGQMPSEDTLKEVVINDSCYRLLKDKLHKDPLDEYLNVNYSITYYYVDFDDTYINDDFIYERKIKISGVVDELDYLQTPKIYFSQVALESYLQDYILPNLSTYNNEDISWYDRIVNAENFDSLSSFSYRIFLKDYKNADLLYSDYSFENLTFTSASLTIRESLLSFLQVGEYAILLFLGLTLIGAVMIMGIVSFASYSEDHKSSAILSCLGATNEQITEIYLNESMLIGFIAVVVSLALSYALAFGINAIISNLINLNNLITVPIYSLFGVPFLFPILSITAALLLCMIVTSIPIIFSKKISLKEELQAL